MNLNGMVSMWKVRELVDKATNIVMNYTETEAKVERFSFSLHHSTMHARGTIVGDCRLEKQQMMILGVPLVSKCRRLQLVLLHTRLSQR